MASTPAQSKTPARRRRSSSSRAGDDAVRQGRSQWTRLSEGGRIVIPVEMRAALGIEPGDKLFLEVRDGTLHLRTLRGAIKHVQEIARPHLPVDRSLADELIAERRAEAARE